MKANQITEDGVATFAQLGYILRSRYPWIIVGTLLGILTAGVYLVVVPPQYQATATVNITPISSLPVAEGRAASSLIDYATEKQLAISASTAHAASEVMGGSWTQERLKRGVQVSGDPNSTVLKISYSDHSKRDAIEGANQLSHAYLQVRTTLVLDRGRDIAAALDQETQRLEQELAALGTATGYQTSLDTVRANTLRDSIKTLQDRKIAMGEYSPRSGEVITPASERDIILSPVSSKFITLGALVGLFVGIVLAFFAHAVSRKPLDEEDLEFLLGVPVWRPEDEVNQPGRWELATEFARHASHGAGMTAILVDTDLPDALAASKKLSSVVAGKVVSLHKSRGALLRSLTVTKAAILITPLTWRKSEYLQLQADLAEIDVELIGVVIAEDDDVDVKSKAPETEKAEIKHDQMPKLEPAAEKKVAD